MKYTALTIGPIISSLGLARKTREIWAASYFFSYFMQLVLENLKENGIVDNVILPYPNKEELSDSLGLEQSDKTGLFPDRIMLQSEEGLYTKLEGAVTQAIATSSDEFKVQQNYLKDYLSIRMLEINSSELTSNNAVFELNSLLAAMELQGQYIPTDKLKFVEMLEKILFTKLYKSKFGSEGYPSIIEIATERITFTDTEKELFIELKKNTNDDEDAIWEKLLEIERHEKARVKAQDDSFTVNDCSVYKKLKLSNKYIAIVQADGDNVGKLIKAIYESATPEAIVEFSKSLSKFALKAADVIETWGGKTIYAGGDDLLFFAPLENHQNKYITDLINEIDAVFAEQILNNEKLSSYLSNPEPSMSYGVSISYYKYPMHEAVNNAQYLLFSMAKQTETKNAIAFRLLKHSGQDYTTILHKNEKLYKEHLHDLLCLSDGLDFNSLLYNLNRDSFILKNLLAANNRDITRLNSYFTNFYKKEIHVGSEAFIEKLKTILFDSFSDTNDFDITLNQVKGVLQLVKFLNTKKHN
ncbi:type III-B CRISPR-associated protein Cas10/Cmr2 [Prolixibacteraceae bacterium JC049]|nr:type III-B CRISPR-associated protein Cas10/Cmr2 [Prolixibacteraceae bacterium JC049]